MHTSELSFSPISAISPIDGRYQSKVSELRSCMSEYALMRFRVLVEIKWLMALAQTSAIEEVTELSNESEKFLMNIFNHFSAEDANEIKNIEKTTNHDVKAVEYFIKEKIKHNPELAQISEFIHFACTSEDINNLAYSLMLKNAIETAITPTMNEILKWLKEQSQQHANQSMLARTHGQPATPTTLGKEFANFYHRLHNQRNALMQLEFMGKINGAVGNYNAHYVAYPEVNWPAFSKAFVESLGLSFNAFTTQIEPHDYIATLCHTLHRFNSILKDMDRDIWAYISNDYFTQKLIEGEVGSSTMPHKVNPIDFENSEGNLGLANALLDFFANQLPTSRWQRDLVDSTILRNLGVAMAHCLIAYKSTLKGLNKLQVNHKIIDADLNAHWEVLAEAVQTVMRRYGIETPYEKLKKFTRGKKINAEILKAFIEQLELPDNIKTQLMQLTPANYTGFAAKLAKDC